MAREESPESIDLLEANPSLWGRLAPAARERAARELQTDAIRLNPGEWDPPRVPPERGHLGFLITQGLMVRRLEVAGGHSVELLTSGDFLRPWQDDIASFVRASWQVLEQTQLAVLTAELARRLCSDPGLAEALFERVMQRSRSLAGFSAIDNVVGVERRVQLVLWYLAERLGRIEGGGVVMPLRVTHQLLAELVGSRRPSVTTALARLAEAGALSEREEGGWRLTGSPPGLDV